MKPRNDTRGVRAALAVAVAMALAGGGLVQGCRTASDAEVARRSASDPEVAPTQTVPASATQTVPATADRPTPEAAVARRCGSHYAEEFDAGLETRTVEAGPVSLVAFRVSPVPSGRSPARNFKVMVRLEPGTDARVRAVSAGTSLLYDRARFSKANVYRLSDGERTVRFVGCKDGPAAFNGAILTNGPRTVRLDVLVDERRIPITVSAFQG